jgi:leucyl-tRNA synthetase
MPEWNESYLVENEYDYPVSVNGKLRFKMLLPLNMDLKEMEKRVLENEAALKWLGEKPPKKVIIVPGKIINIVV